MKNLLKNVGKYYLIIMFNWIKNWKFILWSQPVNIELKSKIKKQQQTTPEIIYNVWKEFINRLYTINVNVWDSQQLFKL